MVAIVLLMKSRSSSSVFPVCPGVIISSLFPVAGEALRLPGDGDERSRGLVLPRLLLRWCRVRLGGDGVAGAAAPACVG